MSQNRSTNFKLGSSSSTSSSNSSITSSPSPVASVVGSLLVSPTYSKNYRITLAPPDSSSTSPFLPFSLERSKSALSAAVAAQHLSSSTNLDNDGEVASLEVEKEGKQFETMPFPLPALPRIQEEAESGRLNLSQRRQSDDEDDENEPRSRARSDRVDSDTADSSLVGGSSINNEDRLSNAPSGYDLHSEISQAVQRAILSNNNTWQSALRKSEEEWSRSKAEGMSALEKRLTDMAKRERETWDIEKRELTTKLDQQMRYMNEELERARTTAMEERAKSASLNGTIERLKSTMIPIKTHEEKFLASELHFKSKVMELEERIKHARLTQEQSFARAQNVLKMQDERLLVQVSIKESELKDKITLMENEHREKRDKLLEDSKRVAAESAEQIKTLRAALDSQTKLLSDEQSAFLKEHEMHLASMRSLEERKSELATALSDYDHCKTALEDVKRALEAERIAHESTKEALSHRGQALLSPSATNREIRSPASPSPGPPSVTILTGEPAELRSSTLSEDVLNKLSLSSIQKKGQAAKASAPVSSLEALALMSDEDGFSSGMELPEDTDSSTDKEDLKKEIDNAMNEIRLLQSSLQTKSDQVSELELKLKSAEETVKLARDETEKERMRVSKILIELENEKGISTSTRNELLVEKSAVSRLQEELSREMTSKSSLSKDLSTLQEALSSTIKQSTQRSDDLSYRLTKSEEYAKQVKSQLALALSALLADQGLHISESSVNDNDVSVVKQGAKRFADLLDPVEAKVASSLQESVDIEKGSRVSSSNSFVSTFLSTPEGRALANARLPSYSAMNEALESLFSLTRVNDSSESTITSEMKNDIASKQPLEASSEALRIVRTLIAAIETHVGSTSQINTSPTKALSIFKDDAAPTGDTFSSPSSISDRNLLSLAYVNKRYSGLLTILRFGAGETSTSTTTESKSTIVSGGSLSTNNSSNIAARTLLSFLRALSTSGALGEAPPSADSAMSALNLLEAALDAYLLSNERLGDGNYAKNQVGTAIADKDVTDMLESLVATVNDMREAAVRSERRAGEASATSTLVREAAHVAMLSMQRRISSLEAAVRETNTSIANGFAKLNAVESKAKDAEAVARDLASRMVRSQASWNECTTQLRKIVLQLEQEMTQLAAFEKKRAPHLSSSLSSSPGPTISSPQPISFSTSAMTMQAALRLASSTSSPSIKAPTRKPPVL